MTDPSPSNAGSLPTRTVAIIKPHALPHRLDIERRITEAGFEIAKERQMMFRVNDSDVEYLFGVNNAISLAEGPCWVYVLERRRAVEVLKTLMGDEDPQIARQSNANCLRALYGTSVDDNALIGSPDTATAEHQISILFASSPPFRTTDLPDSPSFVGQTGSLRSKSSGVLSALSGEGYAASTSQSPTSTSNAGRSSKANSNGFRARPVPTTNATPSVHPRLSRAAALRAGIVQPNVSIWHEGPRQALSKEDHDRTFSNVPGHKRAETITVASTAPPAVAPRMTRAASLRQGIKDVSSTKPRVRDSEAEKRIFEGVPGHRRRETLQVASVNAPTVAPRINRSAALRAEKDRPPPTSFMFRTPSALKTPSYSDTSATSSQRPSLSRSSSSSQIATSPAIRRPSTAPGPGARPASATLSRASSILLKPAPAPSPKRPSSTTPAVSKPTIEPRQNRSALLRAKKLESTRDGSGKINGRPVFV